MLAVTRISLNQGGTMKRSWVCVSVFVVGCVIVMTPVAYGQAHVVSMTFSTHIQNREPADGVGSFTDENDSVYCFTRISTADAPTSIYHVWYYQGQEKFRIALAVRHKTWRTWSSRTTNRLISQGEGKWRVDVETTEGKVLKSKEFTIRSVAEGD